MAGSNRKVIAMKKAWLRIFALVLAAVMFITAAPLGIFGSALDDLLNSGVLDDPSDSSASVEGSDVPTVTEPKYEGTDDYTLDYEDYVGWDKPQTEFRRDETSGIWIIDSPNALRQFEQAVNGGTSFKGETVELRANIDYDGDNVWTPVGYHKDRPFMGTFKGCGHEIINLDITYNSENTVDSEVYYIGFFGYVKDATVQDFGIYSYSVDQDYNYDVEIGGIVGHSENSKFTDCYADGEIKTGFEAINPLERDEVITLTSVPSSLNYENPNGQGVVIDLREGDIVNLSSPRYLGETITVKGDVTALAIWGTNGKLYKDLTIIIEDNSWPSIYLDFSISISDVKIYSSSGKNIYISGYGTLRAPAEEYAINAPNATITFCDYCRFDIYGGDGKNAEGQKKGTVDGNDGGDGWCGVVAERIVVNTEGSVNIHGGNGGNGADGTTGNSGTSYGADGDIGGAGGTGGQGGLAVYAEQIKGISGALALFGGDSGDGGDGGQGGQGAAGKDGTLWTRGGNGGDGGRGGKGGNAYYGISPTNNTPILSSDKAAIALVNGRDGNVGEGGPGGRGGVGGNKGAFSSGGSPGGSLGPGPYGDMLSPNYAFGLFDTEVFGSGNNNPFTVYQNTSAGVTLSVQNSSSGLFPYEIKVTSQGGASPWHLGGIVESTQGSVGKVFYSVVYAKLPVGYRLGACSNSLGNNSYTYFLTSNEGTGDYEWYVVKTQCGDSGTIQDLGYLALYGDQTAKDVVWNVSYYNIYESEEYSVEELSDDAYILSDATATIGGFAGVVDVNSTLTKCATTIDIDRKQEYGARFEKNGHYYQLFANRMGYYEAKAFCESLGGYLTTITSAEENSFVYSLTAGHQIWLGGSDRVTENLFRWETGEDFSYSNWHSGEPNNGTVTSGDGQDYIQMWDGGTWDDMYCGGETRSFICEWDSHTVEGKLAGVQNGESVNVIAAKNNNGTLEKYDPSTWFGNSVVYDDQQASVVNSYTYELLTVDEENQVFTYTADTQGLVYSNGVTAQNNRVSECAVLGKIGEACDVTVPACVFGGRFIMDVTSIAKWALSIADNNPYNGSLENCTVTVGENVKNIGENAFRNSDVASVTIGSMDSSYNGKASTTIGQEAFANCTALTSIVLGDCVISVGAKLLTGCSSLESISIGASLANIPEVKPDNHIDSRTPFGIDKTNSSLNEYIVSDLNPSFMNVNKDGILYEKFHINLSGTDHEGRKDILTELSVAVIDAPVAVDLADEDETYKPANYVLCIYPKAFYHNKKIKKVQLDYIREIGKEAFAYCSNLETVKFGELEKQDEEIQILNSKYPEAVERYLTTVGDYAFANCYNLCHVNFETETLKKIGAYAFANCASPAGDDVVPMEVHLGKNIEMLGTTAELLQDDLPQHSFASVFYKTNVRSFSVESDSKYFIAKDGVLFFKRQETSSSGKKVLWLAAYPNIKNTFSYQDSSGEAIHKYVVNPSGEDAAYLADPEFWDTYEVTRISPNAFENAQLLEHLVLGKGVRDVMGNAIQGMASVHTIEIGADVVVLNGEEEDAHLKAFDLDLELMRIIVDKDNENFCSVDGVLFNKGMTQIIKYPPKKEDVSYKTPQSVTTICENSFVGNRNIRSLSITGEKVDVGKTAFSSCSNLTFICFEQSDVPDDLASKEAMESKARFNTGNSRTMVCYKNLNSKWPDVKGAYYGKSSLENGQKTLLFTIDEYKSVPTDFKTNTGYYAFVVMDKSGVPLNDINVNLVGSGQAINTINGISVFYNLDFEKEYQLVVFDNQGEYFPLENNTFYLDEETRITYITLSSVPTVSGVNVQYEVNTENKIVEFLSADDVIGDHVNKTVDINSETAKINKWCIDEITVKVTCGMDGDVSVIGYSIVQNGQDKKTQTDPKVLKAEITVTECSSISANYLSKKNVSITTSIGTDKLDVEKDVYIVVHFSDGSQVPCKLNMHVFDMSFIDVDLSWLTEGLKFDMAMDSFSFLGGVEYEIELFPKLPLSYVIEIKEDSYKIKVKTNEEDDDDGNKFKPNDDGEGDWSCHLEGSVEIKYQGQTADGKNDIEVVSSIGGVLKGSMEFDDLPTIMVICIPVKIEMELSLTNKIQFKMVFDDGYILPEGVDFEVKAGFEFRAGIGCAAMSAGIYGGVEVVFVVGLVPDLAVKKVELGGDVGLYAKLDLSVVTLEARFSFIKAIKGEEAKAVIYDYEYPENNGWFPPENYDTQLSAVAVAEVLCDESNYVLATSSFDPEIMTFSLTDPSEMYGGIAPQMVQVGNLVYIVYHEDLKGYNDQYDENNYQKLVYRIYNLEDGSFSDVDKDGAPDVFVLDDNGYTDGNFELYTDGENVVIVYAQSNTKLESSYDQIEATDPENQEDQEEMKKKLVESMEIKTAVLTDGVFVPAETSLTNDQAYDMYLHVGELNGKITAVWVKNEDNTLFGTTENNALSLWYSVYENGAWSDAACLRDGINTVTDVAIGPDSIAYITDVNNNMITVGDEEDNYGTFDRLITVLDLSGEEMVVTITAEEAAYHDVTYMDGKLVYYVNNNLYEMDTSEALFESAVQDLPNSYTVLVDETGRAKAILFVKSEVVDEETQTGADHIYGIFRDGEAWGAPICLTQNVECFGEGYYVSAYDVIDRGDGMLLSVLLYTSVLNPDSDDEYNQYELEYLFETIHVEYPTDHQMGEISFNHEEVEENTDITMQIAVTNTGYLTLTQVPVSVSWGDRDDQKHSTVVQTEILPGATENIEFSFNPGAATTNNYTVIVGDDDIAVYGKQVIIGGVYHIVAHVTNLGYLPATYVLTVKQGETVIDEYELLALAPQDKKYITIPLAYTEGSELITLSLNADDEYVTDNNVALINIAADAEQLVETDSLMVWISANEIIVNRTAPEDMSILFNENYQLVSVTVNGEEVPSGLYSIDGDAATITFYADEIADAYSIGTYTLNLKFTDGTTNADGEHVYKFNSVEIVVTEFFHVIWIENGIASDPEQYLLGTTPARQDPVKESTAQYNYEFIGWDSNGDSEPDPMTAITGDITYVAVFEEKVNTYEITWEVDGVLSAPVIYEYGEIPEYGMIPTKEADAQYEYTFAGWDKPIAQVSENTTYVAQFTQTLRFYSITFVVNNETTTVAVPYGNMPTFPVVEDYTSGNYQYSFSGWTPTPVVVTGDMAYTAVFSSTQKTYTVNWNVNGVVISEVYTYGEIPVYPNGVPQKEGDIQYSYKFVDWMESTDSVTGTVTYTAVFESVLNNYTVTGIVDGVSIQETYRYGEIPVFKGETSKVKDEAYRYVFTGWDREIEAVCGDACYTAVYESILLGYAVIRNTGFHAAWSCEFTTTISLTEIQNMDETVVTVFFNPILVTLDDIVLAEGVTLLGTEENCITLSVTGLSSSETVDIAELTFIVSEYAPEGESTFLMVSSEDTITPGFTTLRIYQVGDVNMDGRVNTVDAAMIQRYAVKKIDLTETQKVYGNVNGDLNQDGTAKLNTVDAAMIQRFAVKKLDTLGDRITITFVDNEEETCISLVIGRDVNDYFAPGEGYAWSLEKKTLVEVDFSTLTANTVGYLVQSTTT